MRPLIFLIAFFAPSAWAENGRLIAISPAFHYSKKSLDLSKRLLKAATLSSSRSGASAFRVLYETTDAQERQTQASGLLMIPDGSPNHCPLVSYQHGIVLLKNGVPSRASINMESMAAALIFGSMGYCVVAADMIGLGDSPGFHPFLHAQSEANAGRDLLIASQTHLKQLGIDSSDQLFLVGYSQGGHATLALMRELESNPLPGLTVSGSAAMAGPFDLSETSFFETLERPSNRSTLYFAYLLQMLVRNYPDRAPSLSSLVGESSARTLDGLFDGQHGMDEIMAALPLQPKDLFLPTALEEMKSNPDHPIRQLLRENNVYDWKPRAPVFLAHGRDDRDVSYLNSEKTFQTMKAKGGSVFLEDLGLDKNHTTAIVPAFLRAYYWVERFRRR